MSEAFINILNLSVTASIVVVAVLLLRLGMKKAPKWISVALWAFVGARLMFPFAVESRFSIIPTANAFSPSSAPSDNTHTVYKGLTTLNGNIGESIATAGASGKTYDVFEILALIWIIGMAALLIYGVVSYIMLYLKIRTAVPLKDNVYQSEHVKSPFVLGFIKPRIFIPFNLDEGTLEHVLSHERAHIKRFDHITKPLAYILLSLHWFNPFIWISYILLCRDIEVACDEKVIRNLSLAGRKNYALALLNCKVRNTTVAVCPVAFGEVSVTSRIKKTLKYKKPAMWVVVAAIAVAIIASGCLLTNPQAETYQISVGPVIETTNPAETAAVANNPDYAEGEASLPTEAFTEPITEPTEPENITEATEAEPVYSDEAQNEDSDEYYYEEPMTIQSFEEYYNEVILPQIEAEIMQKRYDTLKKDTAQHADTCPCPTCDELREAGIYPPLVVPETTVVTPTEAPQEYNEGEVYYYYEYEDNGEKDYTELEIPDTNN